MIQKTIAIIFLLILICCLETFAETNIVCFQNKITGNIKHCKKVKGKNDIKVTYKFENKQGLFEEFVPGNKWDLLPDNKCTKVKKGIIVLPRNLSLLKTEPEEEKNGK